MQAAPPPLRAKYDAIAKAEKGKYNIPEKKFTSTGIPLDVIAQHEADRKDAIEAERQDIKNFVMQKSVNKSQYETALFYILHLTFFVCL